MKTSNRIVVLVFPLAVAFSMASCSGIVLSDIVNNRAVQKGVSQLMAVNGGDRAVRLEWTPPENCSVASYRIVNETTAEEFSVSGSNTSYLVAVPKNEARYQFAIYSIDNAGVASKCKTTYGATSRGYRSSIGYYWENKLMTRREYEDFEINEGTGKPISSVIGIVGGVYNPPDEITVVKEDPYGSSAFYYDYDGNEIAHIVYAGVGDGKTVESAVRAEYDSSNNWIKKSTFKAGDVLDYYETAERSSSGAVERKNRYGSDNLLIYYQDYTYNADGSMHDYCRYNSENVLTKSYIYTYDNEGKLTRMESASWSIEYQYYIDTGDVRYEINYNHYTPDPDYVDSAYEYFY